MSVDVDITKRLSRGDIPIALRYGIGRMGFNEWDRDGCVGFPYGSLLVAKSAKGCGKIQFTELEFTGLPGDSPAGTPVKMFPDCSGVDNPFSPFASCVK